MGNAPAPSTDGFVFRGAGLSQVTGRSGVTALQTKLDANEAGFNILTNPELIIDPAHALECGVADFIVCGCLPHAVADDVVGVTRALNGGLNGLADRTTQLALWKAELGV
jgi:putative chitinase